MSTSMRFPRSCLAIRLLLPVVLSLCGASAASAAVGPVVRIAIDGPIGPATADYVHRGLEQAVEQGAQLVVLEMDTPGGLDTSMRAIIKDILASPVPVAAFVSPRGARAASAGTYILYASHIAAMAPATNLGAATPVSIGGPKPESSPIPGMGDDKEKTDKGEEKKGKDEATGTDAEAKDDGAKEAAKDESTKPLAGDAMTRKVVHDASAYIRGLAQLRGRNAEWAERAVREAVSLSASEAAEINVIDLVAEDVPDLLMQLDGREIEAAGQKRTLETAGAVISDYEPDFRTRFLQTITNPSIAYILLIIGIYGLIFEFSNPGLIGPGVVGAICLVVALYALQLLPVSYAGLALVLLGIGMMIAEAFLPSFGVLGIGGLVAFAIGSIILIDTEAPGFGVPIGLVLGVTGASAAFVLLVIGMALRSRKRPVVSGREQMVGAVGEVLDDFTGEGWARVHGETWRVHSDEPLKAGTRVRVAAMKGLALDVIAEPAEQRGD